MEYTGEMENHYLCLFSFIIAEAHQDFRAFAIIPPLPHTPPQAGFIKSLSQLWRLDELRRDSWRPGGRRHAAVFRKAPTAGAGGGGGGAAGSA